MLNYVYLKNNVCIDINFSDSTEIAAMPLTVSQMCGFVETADQMFEKVLQGQERQIEMQQIFMNQTIVEKQNCQLENTKLNSELVAAVRSKDRCEMQFSMFKDLSDKLELQFNKTLALMTQDLNNIVQLKTSENQDLLNELQNNKNEINDKNIQIKTLEEQIKRLDESHKW